jgi:hypothetical protein
MAKIIKPEQSVQAPAEHADDNVVRLTAEELAFTSTPGIAAASIELDPEALRLDQNFVDVGGSKKLIDIIDIIKPPKQEFVRAHPDPNFSWIFGILELKGEGEKFVVTPEVARVLGNEIYPAQLTTAITRHEVLFAWEAKVPQADNSVASRWHNSMFTAKEHARKQWVRVVANKRAGYYETRVAEMQPPDPVWPDLTPKQILNIIIRGRLITSLDHPALKQLRGA